MTGEKMNFSEFKRNVENWAEVRGIYVQSTEAKQVAKGLEEVGELLVALEVDSRRDIEDAIGDVAVCVVNAAMLADKRIYTHVKPYNGCMSSVTLATMALVDGGYSTCIMYLAGLSDKYDVKFESCLNRAWDEIKHRKGMMVDGFYVKYESMTTEQQREFDDRSKGWI